jgi:hypothetical protein
MFAFCGFLHWTKWAAFTSFEFGLWKVLRQFYVCILWLSVLK